MFVLYLKQKGEGCDYTIGCGSQLIELPEAKTFEEALIIAGDIVTGKFIIDEEGGYFEDGYWDESEISYIRIFDDACGKIDTKRWYDKAKKIESNHNQKIKNDKEYKQYLKLKNKFEGK